MNDSRANEFAVEIEMAIDGNPATAWGIHPAEGKSHWATLRFAEPLSESGLIALGSLPSFECFFFLPSEIVV